MTTTRRLRWLAGVTALALTAAACGGDDTTQEPETDDGTAVEDTDDGEPEDDGDDGDDADGSGEPEGPITVYSGRAEELVGSVMEDFTAETGIELEVRYGDTAELAAQIIAEGDASPADVFYAQDAGALGALEVEDRFTTLSEELTSLVDPAFASSTGSWVGVTGRVRVLTYNTDNVSEDELPDSVLDLTDPEWSGRVSWAPTNGSFQAFVTALRVTEGEDVTRQWLEDMIANDVQVFENNGSQVEAIGRGEVDVAIVNHYYLYRFLAEDPDFPGENLYLPGDIGGMINATGVGILSSSDQQDAAEQFIAYLLSDDVQNFFGTETAEREFPAVEGIEATDLPTIEELGLPAVDLTALEDLEGTLALLQEVGALQ